MGNVHTHTHTHYISMPWCVPVFIQILALTQPLQVKQIPLCQPHDRNPLHKTTCAHDTGRRLHPLRRHNFICIFHHILQQESNVTAGLLLWKAQNACATMSMEMSAPVCLNLVKLHPSWTKPVNFTQFPPVCSNCLFFFPPLVIADREARIWGILKVKLSFRPEGLQVAFKVVRATERLKPLSGAGPLVPHPTRTHTC